MLLPESFAKLGIALVAALFSVACDDRCNFQSHPRVQLVDAFVSGMTRDDLAQMSQESVLPLDWQVVRDEIVKVPDRECDVRLVTVRASQYRVLESTGVIELSFVNDLMFHVLFFPDDLEGILASMRGVYDVPFRLKESVTVDGISILAGDSTLGRTGGYVSWSDPALEHEYIATSN